MKSWFKIDLWKRVMVALVLGLGVGIALRYGMGPEESGAFAKLWIGWLGELFLRMIKMMIIPLVFFTLVSGVIAMGDPKKLGSLGGRCESSNSSSTRKAIGRPRTCCATPSTGWAPSATNASGRAASPVASRL